MLLRGVRRGDQTAPPVNCGIVSLADPARLPRTPGYRVLTQQRNTSATLQACAMQPRGV
jgi:hypothetical protein